LKDWGGYDEEKIKSISAEELSADKEIKEIQELKLKLAGNVKVTQEDATNINKILIGKMASLSRKQESIKNNEQDIIEDVSQKMWEDIFSKEDLQIQDLIESKFANLNFTSKKQGVDKRKLDAYVSIFNNKIYT
jgi:hypothetical protein